MLPAAEPETIVKIDTPAGPVVARARISNGRVKCVYFENVPSFVPALDEKVSVPGLGKIRYDLAFGGAFYAYVEAKEVGLECSPDQYRSIIGSRFSGWISGTNSFGPHPAVIPQVEGSAYITDSHEFLIDP